MTLDASGTLHGTPTTLGDFSFTVKAQDAAWQANAATAPVALTVVAPVFSVTAPAASPAMVGQSYAAAFTAVGNVGGVSWTVASGVLPAGLTLDAAAGTINGQPTAWGSFAALVQGADSIGRAEAAPITIVVSPTPLTISTTTLAPATFKTAYSATLGANGGTGLVAWTLTGGALPRRDAQRRDRRRLGTPVQAGTFVFECAPWMATGKATSTRRRLRSRSSRRCSPQSSRPPLYRAASGRRCRRWSAASTVTWAA